VLFCGTLRSNLDPGEIHSDTDLWKAVEDVHLDTFVRSRDGQLDMLLDPNGANLSDGQRQLFCLARAILRKSKVLVLDEATASVDKTTDDLIQETLKRLRGVTMLTIAHWLDTNIDYDLVAVVNDGTVVEYDQPRRLFANPTTQFSAMWEAYMAKGE